MADEAGTMANGTVLYLECASGISGDMVVAALLDLGASQQRLEAALASLPVSGFTTRVSRVRKAGLDACDFDVVLDAAHENHDHDMAYLYGHLAAGSDEAGACDNAAADCEHEHEECERESLGLSEHEHHHDCDGPAHEHTHEHGHPHAHDHAHTHEHRTLADVTAILDGARLSPGARAIAGRIFDVLARAEAHAHGATPETVHFHEVGAVDSIVDIVSAAVCLDDLGVHDVIVPELSEGTGTIRCAHGIMPVPVPAVVNIVSEAGIALRPTSVRGELVTPTGAAIVAATRTRDQLPARYAIRAVGLGAGKRSYEGCAGVLRAMLIEPLADGAPSSERDAIRETTGNPFAAAPVIKLETDIDDANGEALGYVVEQLMAAGARDAHIVPTIMKKGRPGCQLQVICDEADVERLEALMFTHTTTIGIRRMRMERDRLPREAVEVATAFGPIAGKRVMLPNGTTRTYPEHASIAQTCERTGASYQDVVRAFLAAAQ